MRIMSTWYPGHSRRTDQAENPPKLGANPHYHSYFNLHPASPYLPPLQAAAMDEARTGTGKATEQTQACPARALLETKE